MDADGGEGATRTAEHQEEDIQEQSGVDMGHDVYLVFIFYF